MNLILVSCALFLLPTGLPTSWQAAWQKPPLSDRPLQIVHALADRKASPEAMSYYLDRGLGGVVTNVPFHQYMQSEERWKNLVAAVEACARRGMVVWLYDEEGYPSGSAGGLVLREHPDFEARALTWQPTAAQPFSLRRAYEHAHPSNNYHAARRYINLLDPRATATFLAKTHESYWQRLEPHFGKTIQATFTDEPSLVAVNMGQLPERVRDKVRVVDPIDPKVAPLPCVPWSNDLAELYRRRYREDLVAQRKSLFTGDAPEDRRVRSRFWGLVAELVSDGYFGQIQRWCAGHRIASSGHTLAEENLLLHVPLEGNGLKCLGRMDIPGLDMLTSAPEAVLASGWMTAAMPSSAAVLHGRRRVMTEVSDFAQRMFQKGPASVAEMKATAAWQAAWGVTEFTLYYHPDDRSIEEYRAYGDYLGRLNAMLKPASIDREVLLYYPVHDLWAEYRPTAEPPKLNTQSPRAQRLVTSFNRLGRALQTRQAPFVLADHESLASAKLNGARALVVPEGVEFPDEARSAVEKFRLKGGLVVADRAAVKPEVLIDSLKPRYRLTPPERSIVLGTFRREGRAILLLVNVGREAYRGRLAVDGADWLALNPATGAVENRVRDTDGLLPLTIAAREALILVGPPQ